MLHPQNALSTRSTITQRGQTVVPAAIRQQFNLGPADRLEWVVQGQHIRVVPVRADPVAAFRGRGQGGSVQRLLAQRRQDGARE